MDPITTTRGDTILAHHTTESPNSHYGQPIWQIEESDPGPGPAIWRQGDNAQPITIVGVVGGWLVARQRDGLLCGILWSDGNYYANVIEDRRHGRPAKGAALTSLCSARYQVRGAVAVAPFDEDSPLGCILG